MDGATFLAKHKNVVKVLKAGQSIRNATKTQAMGRARFNVLRLCLRAEKVNGGTGKGRKSFQSGDFSMDLMLAQKSKASSTVTL